MRRERGVDATFKVGPEIGTTYKIEMADVPSGSPLRAESAPDGAKEQSPCRLALEAVYGDRQDHYDHPSRNFDRIARLWTAYLFGKYAVPVKIEPRDVAWLNILQKCSRDMHNEKLDNLTDTAGYAEAMSRLGEG